MNPIAIIPARKGSKRLPEKNIKPLNGKPLIQYTVEAAQRSGVFDQIILTTDDLKIHEMFRKTNGIVLDVRDPSLATDAVQCNQVLHYVIAKHQLIQTHDYLCMLLPTCPLRTARHIQESFEIVKNNQPDSVVSIKKYDFPPYFPLEITDGKLKKRFDGIVQTHTAAPAYHPNGAIVWMKISVFYQNQMESYYTDNTLPYLMDWKASVDIDDADDFKKAEMILSDLSRNPIENETDPSQFLK